MIAFSVDQPISVFVKLRYSTQSSLSDILVGGYVDYWSG